MVRLPEFAHSLRTVRTCLHMKDFVNRAGWMLLTVSIGVVILTQGAWAADYYSWLAVRYSDNKVLKTFLQGPYDSKASCDKLNQITWDNVFTACGSCTVEMKHCDRLENLSDGFRKLLRRERAAMPYAIATPKGRIFFSGMPTNTAINECHHLAASFQNNGYSEARCVVP